MGMTTGSDWREAVGRTWAENYRLTDRSFTGLTEQLLARIGNCEGQNVLDIGCGAGEISIAVARSNKSANLIGVDVSPTLIATATKRGADHANLRFEEADAGSWKPSDFAADKLISRHGVMFFDVPRAAFSHLREISRPGAELIFTCFRSPALNAWASEMASLLQLPPNPNPYAPGPFAFAEPDHVHGILGDAGWRNIDMAETDFAYIAGVGEDPVEDALQFFARIGPAAPALRALQGDEREQALGRVRDWLERHRSGNLVAMAGAAWIVTAKA